MRATIRRACGAVVRQADRIFGRGVGGVQTDVCPGGAARRAAANAGLPLRCRCRAATETRAKMGPIGHMRQMGPAVALLASAFAPMALWRDKMAWQAVWRVTETCADLRTAANAEYAYQNTCPISLICPIRPIRQVRGRALAYATACRAVICVCPRGAIRVADRVFDGYGHLRTYTESCGFVC